MFKKNVTAAGAHQLGGKDVKKFKADLTKSFPALTPDELTAILPPKATVTQTKLSNRAVVYSVNEGNPLFFDATGHGDALLPTVYALTLYPRLLPTLHTHSEVSPKVVGGADLFLQGLLVPPTGLPEFLAGSARSVSVPGNPVPFAVGKMAVSRSEALREGMKGRGVTVIHAYGDLLWGMGDGKPPNEGFKKDRVYPLAGEPESEESGEGGEEESNAVEHLAGLNISDSGVGAETAGDVICNGSEDLVDEVSGTGNLDTLLEQAVIGGLHSLKAAELPIMASDFYQKHMQPLKPAGITFDFKQSKYKKLSKLLDKFEKEKLLKQKSVRKQDHISAVDRLHPLYVGWEGDTAPGSANTTAREGNGAGASTSAAAAPRGPLTMVEALYRAPTSLRHMFGEDGADKERLYSESEVSAALTTYAQSQGLLSSDGKSVTIDVYLASSLWGKKEGPAAGEALSFPALLTRLLSKLQLWHRVTRPAGGAEALGKPEVLRKGSVKPITVLAERRHGRNVTAVAHVEGFGFDADELSGAFARKFKTACSVSKLPGKNEADAEIMLQGDVMLKMVEYLNKSLGIESKYIESATKIKK